MNGDSVNTRAFALIIHELRTSQGEKPLRFIQNDNSGIDEEIILTMLRAWLRKKEDEYYATFSNTN